MYIIVYNPYDDYHHWDESWEVYDTSTFHDYTKEGFDNFVAELDGWNVQNAYKEKKDMPEHLLQERKDVRWFNWSQDLLMWEEVPLDTERMQKNCKHRWDSPYLTSKTFDSWSRKCRLCDKVEHASGTRDEIKKIPVF